MIRKALRSKRGRVRAASLLIAAFVIAGGLAVTGYQEAATYRWHLQTGYQHSFAELTTAMEELDTALQKGVYATSPCSVKNAVATGCKLDEGCKLRVACSGSAGVIP